MILKIVPEAGDDVYPYTGKIYLPKAEKQRRKSSRDEKLDLELPSVFKEASRNSIFIFLIKKAV